MPRQPGHGRTLSSRGARFANTLVATTDILSTLRGWKRLVTAFFLGFVSVAAVAPIFAWPVLLITFPAVVLMLGGIGQVGNERSRSGMLQAAGIGWWFGFGYFMAGLHWIVEPFLVEADTFAWLIPFAVTLMPAGLALFFAAATFLARLYWLPGWTAAIPLAIAFGLMEWLRGWLFTGFPWNPLGDGLTGNIWTLQWASVIGINGLNVLSVLLFAVPGLLAIEWATHPSRRRKTVTTAIVGALSISLALGWGVQRAAHTTPSNPDVRLRLVQPNIPQEQKWQPDKRRWVFDQLLDLSRQNDQGRVDDLAGITHVIWPEVAMPFFPLRAPQALKEIAELLPERKVLITGALRAELAADSRTGNRNTYNTLLAFDDTAGPIARYDKQHLVPFGEYLPFQAALEALGLQQLTRLRGGFSFGVDNRAMSLPGLPTFTPLICYEVIFSGAVVTTPERPAWLLVVTNDAWFGKWAGPRQHFHQVRVRAVEEGLPLVRVSNNGISAVVTPLGHVAARLELNERGVLDAALPQPLAPTLFARYGNAGFWALLLLCGLVSIGVRRTEV